MFTEEPFSVTTGPWSSIAEWWKTDISQQRNRWENKTEYFRSDMKPDINCIITFVSYANNGRWLKLLNMRKIWQVPQELLCGAPPPKIGSFYWRVGLARAAILIVIFPTHSE